MAEEFREVVVIGAGASGLFAAQNLKSRFPDVLVVEATNRIGGRVHQVIPKVDADINTAAKPTFRHIGRLGGMGDDNINSHVAQAELFISSPWPNAGFQFPPRCMASLRGPSR